MGMTLRYFCSQCGRRVATERTCIIRCRQCHTIMQIDREAMLRQPIVEGKFFRVATPKYEPPPRKAFESREVGVLGLPLSRCEPVKNEAGNLIGIRSLEPDDDDEGEGIKKLLRRT